MGPLVILLAYTMLTSDHTHVHSVGRAMLYVNHNLVHVCAMPTTSACAAGLLATPLQVYRYPYCMHIDTTSIAVHDIVSVHVAYTNFY